MPRYSYEAKFGHKCPDCDHFNALFGCECENVHCRCYLARKKRENS